MLAVSPPHLRAYLEQWAVQKLLNVLMVSSVCEYGCDPSMSASLGLETIKGGSVHIYRRVFLFQSSSKLDIVPTLVKSALEDSK